MSFTQPTQKRRIWAWYFFDWATQPVYTLLLTFIFAPYFVASAIEHYQGQGYGQDSAAVAAQALWGTGLTVAGLFIAFSSPFLGAIADLGGRRKWWISFFSALVIFGAATTWVVFPDGQNILWGLIAFGVCYIGAEWGLNFINSYLGEIDSSENAGRHSANAFALGFLGGLIALFIVLAFFAQGDDGYTYLGLPPVFGLANPEAGQGTRAVGFFVAIWYGVFLIPFFLWFRDLPPESIVKRFSVRQMVARLKSGLGLVIRQPSCRNFLLAAMFYRDALNALYAFGGVYATIILGWSVPQIGVFGIIAAASAGFFTWVGGYFDKYFGARAIIFSTLILLIGVCVILVGTSRESFFGLELAPASRAPDFIMYGAGCFIGALGGILQASSRTLMLAHVQEGRASEFFGFYALSGKATAFIAPFAITSVTLVTQSPKLGFLPLIGLFGLGFLFMCGVGGKANKYGDAQE